MSTVPINDVFISASLSEDSLSASSSPDIFTVQARLLLLDLAAVQANPADQVTLVAQALSRAAASNRSRSRTDSTETKYKDQVFNLEDENSQLEEALRSSTVEVSLLKQQVANLTSENKQQCEELAVTWNRLKQSEKIQEENKVRLFSPSLSFSAQSS
jgi:septal ring factor EnvC (AmiA/AmiB activator)